MCLSSLCVVLVHYYNIMFINQLAQQSTLSRQFVECVGYVVMRMRRLSTLKLYCKAPHLAVFSDATDLVNALGCKDSKEKEKLEARANLIW